MVRVLFRRAEARVDAQKWVPDPFQAPMLAPTLTLTLPLMLGVNRPLPIFNKFICDVVLFFCSEGRKYLPSTKTDSSSEVGGNCLTNNQQIKSKLKLYDKKMAFKKMMSPYLHGSEFTNTGLEPKAV